MNKILTSFLTLTMTMASAFTAAADDVKCNPDDIQGVATFKSDGVNLRKGPSATDPYLCTVTFGDDLYYSMADLCWSSEAGRAGKIHKQQAYAGQSMPVIGREGDWVKLYFGNPENSFEVWTMSKFVDISPLGGEINTRSVTNPDWGPNAFTCLLELNPRCAYYNEGGMDDDPGMYIGKLAKGDKIAVFDLFVPVSTSYNESEPGIKVVKDPEYGSLQLLYGPKFLNENGNEYSGFNMRALNGKILTELAKYGNPTSAIAIIAPDGYVRRY